MRGLYLVFELSHCFFKKLAIHLVTHGRDVAGLLRAKDVAGAADFQVAHGDFEARAKM